MTQRTLPADQLEKGDLIYRTGVMEDDGVTWNPFSVIDHDPPVVFDHYELYDPDQITWLVDTDGNELVFYHTGDTRGLLVVIERARKIITGVTITYDDGTSETRESVF